MWRRCTCCWTSTLFRNPSLRRRSQKRKYGTRCRPGAPARRFSLPSCSCGRGRGAPAEVMSYGRRRALLFRTAQVCRHDALVRSSQPRKVRPGFRLSLGLEMNAILTTWLPIRSHPRRFIGRASPSQKRHFSSYAESIGYSQLFEPWRPSPKRAFWVRTWEYVNT